MTTQDNKHIVRRFYQAFEANDEAALREVLAPSLVARTHGSPDPQNLNSQLQSIRNWNATFSDTSFTIEEQIADGDKVATCVTLRGVHNRGVFQGMPPSGKRIEAEGISIETIADGQIVERRVQSDWFGMMQQLGLLPPR